MGPNCSKSQLNSQINSHFSCMVQTRVLKLHTNFLTSSIIHACQFLTLFLFQMVQIVFKIMKLHKITHACKVWCSILHIQHASCLNIQNYNNYAHACLHMLKIQQIQFKLCSWPQLNLEFTKLQTQTYESTHLGASNTQILANSLSLTSNSQAFSSIFNLSSLSLSKFGSLSLSREQNLIWAQKQMNESVNWPFI